MRAVRQRILSVAQLLVFFALASGVAGFVYAHEPERDQQVVALDRAAGQRALLSGTVTRVGNGRITIQAEGGAIDLALPDGTSIEELRTAGQSALVPGAQVNVGVERSDFGFALTGVVVVAGP
jgi:hypothetical protein